MKSRSLPFASLLACWVGWLSLQLSFRSTPDPLKHGNCSVPSSLRDAFQDMLPQSREAQEFSMEVPSNLTIRTIRLNGYITLQQVSL